MPNVINRANGKPSGGGAKEQSKSVGAAKNVEPGLFDKVKQMPPRLLIGGGVTLAIVLLACLWFLFGVGPEDSGKAAESASVAPAAPRPTATAAAGGEAGTSSVGSQGASTSAPQTPTAAPNAPPAASPGYANNPPAGMPANNAPAMAPGAGTPPPEVEGLPPVTGGAGKGTTWHPTDAPGTVISHGPASDP